eukprot:GEMP01024127.1.p1 GENE.GEMP01024127.1~~GEMP01024127.1.p1  ORF type:complete len:572 (+),score=112.65 GEMP01024127.1:90-1805(+)
MVSESAVLLQRFREHASFICLAIIAFTCLVYLMTELRAILQPLVWAMVLVMVLFPITARVEASLSTLVQKCCSMERKGQAWRNIYKEMRAIGQKRMAVGPDGHHKPAAQCAGVPDNPEDPASPRGPMENRGVGKPQAKDSDINLAPALPHRRPSGIRYDGHGLRAQGLRPRHSGGCMPRCCGVCASITVILVCIAGFSFMVIDSIYHLKEDIAYYEIGAQRIANTTQTILARVFVKLPKKVVDDITTSVVTSAQAWVSSAIGGTIHHVGEMLVEGLMMFLYLTFLLCAPIPTSERTHALFQRYIYMKSASCFGYGLSVGILLYVLKVDLAVVFGLTAFIFNFVPEVGAFIAMLLPLPVILLDSRIDNPFFTFAVASMGQMGLKFLFGTVLEVKMVESDQLMRMHPVVILVAVAFFGYLWGPTGMLVSVPIMGYFKISLLNDSVPAVYRDAILVFLEGDVDAPLWHTTKQIYLPDDLEKRRNPSNSMYSYDIEFSATADDADNMTTFALPPPVAPSTSLRRPARDTYAAISVTDTPELNKTVSPPQRRVAEAPTPRVARDERKTNQTHEFGS